MIIKDRIWGKFEIYDKILVDLIKSREVQRLKKISQFGLPQKYYPLKDFSRYEHSLGVMLLLRKLNASVEEQAAGLLHDVSYTAFSHLVDWVIGDRKKENHQDLRHNKVMNGEKISKIIYSNGSTPKTLSNYKNFSLLELPAPQLCADRVDYALREFKDWAAPKIIKKVTLDLINHEGKIVFKSEESARKFAYAYMKLQREHWGGAEWLLRYQLFSEILKYALSIKIIDKSSFDYDEKRVIKILEKSKDKKLKRLLKQVRGTIKYKIVDKNYTYHLHKKFRYVDPEFYDGKKIKKLSEIDKKFKIFLENERKHNIDGIKIYIETYAN